MSDINHISNPDELKQEATSIERVTDAIQNLVAKMQKDGAPYQESPEIMLFETTDDFRKDPSGLVVITPDTKPDEKSFRLMYSEKPQTNTNPGTGPQRIEHEIHYISGKDGLLMYRKDGRLLANSKDKEGISESDAEELLGIIEKIANLRKRYVRKHNRRGN